MKRGLRESIESKGRTTGSSLKQPVEVADVCHSEPVEEPQTLPSDRARRRGKGEVGSPAHQPPDSPPPPRRFLHPFDFAQGRTSLRSVGMTAFEVFQQVAKRVRASPVELIHPSPPSRLALERVMHLHAGGVMEISRGSSEAKTPGTRMNKGSSPRQGRWK